MKKTYTTEGHLLTISSAATIENFAETLTAETAGPCMGPADWADVPDAAELAQIRTDWNHLQEMNPEETAERLEHLADEWGLDVAELQYLV